MIALALSILFEHADVREVVRDCWQTSISAYYYTPVRAIFVGAMCSVGVALIVIKGHRLEDVCLNLAGLLAPVVALAPTTNIVAEGPGCWSIDPEARPVVRKEDGTTELAQWVLGIVDNNFKAYLVVAIAGLVAGAAVAYVEYRKGTRPTDEETPYRVVSFATTAVLLGLGLALFLRWNDFFSRAHGFAAIFMFVFLFLAVVSSAGYAEKGSTYRIAYAIVAVLMLGGAVVIWPTGWFGDHTVFALEAWEISMFAAYWIVQSADNWHERVSSRPVGSVTS